MRRTFAVLTLAIPSISCATTPLQVELDSVLSRADQVLHVKVLSSDVERFSFEGRTGMCGINYRVEVIETVGKEANSVAEISFASRSSLAAGEDYLIAVDGRGNELPPGMQWLERPAYLSSDAYKSCVEKLPGTWAEKVYRFSEYSLGKDGSPKWLIRDEGSPLPADEVQIMKLRCQSDDAEGCGKIGEPVLISWASLKKYIQKSR